MEQRIIMKKKKKKDTLWSVFFDGNLLREELLIYTKKPNLYDIFNYFLIFKTLQLQF